MAERAPAKDKSRRTPAVDPLEATPYRTIAPIGAGGMGEVVEAEHRELHRRVVVKLLHDRFAADAKLVDRMRVEARTLAALAHPNVVGVTDLAWTPAGRAYFVMERLRGRNLREELAERGPLPVLEAIAYARQALAGLAAAHALGIVHRDIKPENIFRCEPVGSEPPVIKVLDFGIAKVLRGGDARAPTPQYPTQEGVLLGTPRSVAPEQALCRPVDARTDVYGVGVLLYTLIAGSGPFPSARDQAELLMAHIGEEPVPLSRQAQAIPPELDRAILRALAKRPEARFQSADEFSAELARIVTLMADEPTLVTSASSPTPTAVTYPAPAPSPAPQVGVRQAATAWPVAQVGAEPPARSVRASVEQEAVTAVQPKVVRAIVRDDAPASRIAPSNLPRRGRAAWVFVVAVVASTALFSLLIALVMHARGAAR